MLPDDVELRIFNELLHNDFKRSASTFLRLSRHHLETYAHRLNHTIVFTGNNTLQLIRLITSGSGQPDHRRRWVKRIVLARMCQDSDLDTFLASLTDFDGPLFPNLQSIIVSRQYCFEATVRIFESVYDNSLDICCYRNWRKDCKIKTAKTATALFDRLLQGVSIDLSVYVDMDVPLGEKGSVYKNGPARPLWYRPTACSVAYDYYWGMRCRTSAASLLLSAFAGYSYFDRPFENRERPPTPQLRYRHFTVRNMPRIWDNPWLQDHTSTDPCTSLTLEFSNIVPARSRHDRVVFEPGNASVDLCDHILRCLADGRQTSLTVQNARITPDVLDQALACMTHEPATKRKTLRDKISKISQLPPLNLIPSPTDFDPLGGSVDCRNWETRDYAAWDRWRLAEKSREEEGGTR